MANARFVLLASNDKQFYFVLRAPNNEVILTGETYPTKVIAQNGIAAVKENAGIDARYERGVASNGAPYFVLKGANHEVIGRASSTRPRLHAKTASPLYSATPLGAHRRPDLEPMDQPAEPQPRAPWTESDTLGVPAADCEGGRRCH